MTRLDRRQGCENRDSSKDRKKLVSKNISRPSNKEYASLTRHHWKHKHWTTGRGNVTFQQWFKAINSRKVHYESGWSKTHRGRKSNLTWKTAGLDEVATRDGVNPERAMEE